MSRDPFEKQVPEGRTADARETWRSSHPDTSWIGDLDLDLDPHVEGDGDGDPDVEWRPGESTTIDSDDPAAVEAARRFRDVLGLFASGVTVVTAISGGQPIGITCQSFSSVSLDPPLVLFVPARTSRAWPLMQRAGTFCVNLLADGQADLSNAMASRGADKFAGFDWTPSAVTGSPTFPGSLGHVDCTIHTVHEAGDHFVVIGRVVDLVAGAEHVTDPLLFFQGTYRTTTG